MQCVVKDTDSYTVLLGSIALYCTLLVQARYSNISCTSFHQKYSPTADTENEFIRNTAFVFHVTYRCLHASGTKTRSSSALNLLVCNYNRTEWIIRSIFALIMVVSQTQSTSNCLQPKKLATKYESNTLINKRYTLAYSTWAVVQTLPLPA